MIQLTALILEAHIESLADKQKYSDILSKSLKLNYNIDAKFPDRDYAAIFNMYINRGNSTTEPPTQQQHQFDLTQDFMNGDKWTHGYQQISRSWKQNHKNEEPAYQN